MRGAFLAMSIHPVFGWRLNDKISIPPFESLNPIEVFNLIKYDCASDKLRVNCFY